MSSYSCSPLTTDIFRRISRAGQKKGYSKKSKYLIDLNQSKSSLNSLFTFILLLHGVKVHCKRAQAAKLSTQYMFLRIPRRKNNIFREVRALTKPRS